MAVTNETAITAGSLAWQRRPAIGWVLRIASVVIPVIGAVMTTAAIARAWPSPEDVSVRVLRWGTLMAAATASLLLIDRLARRLLPLATLFEMSLIFPDAAPSRFAVALRTGTTKQLERRLENQGTGRSATTETQAATTMLELVAALSVHDRFTRGHSERVRAYAALIGEELGLSETELSKLQWAALVHDIGKLAIPREILTKRDQLTPEEYEVIRRHPAAGDHLIEPMRAWLGPWADAVVQHHERIDGRGYPAGLHGEEISLAARIISVADTFDVITAARSYKRPLSAAHGKRELTRCAGTQFDERMVRAFLNVSIGRLRLAMGPLSFFASLPYIGALTAPVSSAAVAAVVGTTVGLGGGIVVANGYEATPAGLALVVAEDEPGGDDGDVAALPADDAVDRVDEDREAPGGEPPPTSSSDSSGAQPPTTETTPVTTGSSPTQPPVSQPTTTLPSANEAGQDQQAATLPPATQPPTSLPPTTIDRCAVAANGDKELDAADLSGCDLSNVTLDGYSLVGADLTGASLADSTITNVNLAGARMAGANLTGLIITDGNLSGAQLTDAVGDGAVFTNVGLQNTELTNARFSGVTLYNSSLEGATMTGGDFTGLALHNSDLRSVQADQVDLRNADLSGAWMWDADFTTADFTDAKLTTADLSRSVLTGATLLRTGLDSTRLTSTVLSAADLTGADLWAAEGLPVGAATATWQDTKCPNGIIGSTNCYP